MLVSSKASNMMHFILLLLSLLILTCLLEFAHLASFLPINKEVFVGSSSLDHKRNMTPPAITPIKLTITTTSAQYNSTQATTTTISSSSPSSTPESQANTPPTTGATAQTTTQTSSTTTSEPSTTTTLDPNADPEDLVPPNVSPSPNGDRPVTYMPPDKSNPNKSGPGASGGDSPQPGGYPSSQSATLELTVLFYSVFMIYVSFTKLIYHYCRFIKRNITEPGILMIFGMIWELVIRQISSNYDAFPKFNSQIFFYLFLPSTVLESASLLSNKWLFINLVPILIHSIIGTLIFASSLGFSIHSLDQQNVFKFTYLEKHHQAASLFSTAQVLYSPSGNDSHTSREEPTLDYASSTSSLRSHNLTLADCLVFGTILSSVDSSIMLSVFRQLRVNEKLYYLVLGEGLLNNAVVLVMFDILLEFFNANKLTMVKIYIVVLQFFITLFGSVFIGLALACVALLSVRLIKRFQVPSSLSSYQGQCQAMAETLLILKLAYLTYTLASIAGTSRIVSLATFGILQDQYIKHTLNLRSQLTLKQVILATKTLGVSLVYPLLGMLLVEVANTTRFSPLTWRPFESSPLETQELSKTEANLGAESLNQENFYWNFRFLSVVIVLAITCRFVVVIVLSVFCNLFSSRQLGLRFREQVLVAYGGLKGPLAFALVHRLIEHEEFRDRAMRNKYLFMYSILFITLISTLIKGSFIRPLVSRMQLPLCQPPATDDLSASATSVNTSIVFNHINFKVTEHLTHGLNSILGHRKSSYDRFIDFNELQLKPWLARDGSNTNWLSVFYDDLMLDETLNANCFYRSTEMGPSMPIFRSSSNRRISSRQNGIGQRLGKSSSLDTIAENLHHEASKTRSTTAGSASVAALSDISSPPVELGQKAAGQTGDKTLLKEFVMLNLKLEKSRQRRDRLLRGRSTATKAKRRSRASKARVNPIASPTDDDADDNGDGFSQPARKKLQPRMLSTTSDEDQAQVSNSRPCDQVRGAIDKQRHLDEIERRLNRHRTSDSKTASDCQLPSQQVHAKTTDKRRTRHNL